MVRGRLIQRKIPARWIQQFIMSNNLFIRVQTGKLSIRLEKQAYIEKSISYYLGSLKRAFEISELQEDYVENADETHFV